MKSLTFSAMCAVTLLLGGCGRDEGRGNVAHLKADSSTLDEREALSHVVNASKLDLRTHAMGRYARDLTVVQREDLQSFFLMDSATRQRVIDADEMYCPAVIAAVAMVDALGIAYSGMLAVETGGHYAHEAHDLNEKHPFDY